MRRQTLHVFFTAWLCCALASCLSGEPLPASVTEAAPTGSPGPTIAPEHDHADWVARDEWRRRGYPCTDDCSGHEAGYEWAEEHNIEDPDDCGGSSQSFTEGCQAYAEELAGE